MTLSKVTKYRDSQGCEAWVWDYSASADEYLRAECAFAWWCFAQWPRREAVRA
jgi:hypothetical protein